MGNDRAKAQMRRQTDAYRMNRKMYLAMPEVRQRMAIKRAIKKHLSPPAVTFGPGKILGGQ
jgi:hypothetical protein